MSIKNVIYNRDLFTYICSFIDVNSLRKIIYSMRNFVHYNAVLPTYNTLLYGEVQSGKTNKITHYIQYYPITTLKVLIIQNSLVMLSQYKNVLDKLSIPFCCISKENEENVYNNEKVIIVIHNKFRMKALSIFMSRNKLANYSLILDESDQYYRKIINQKICAEAKHILHVTATPFIYKRLKIFHDVVKIKPKENYVGINKINIVEIPIVFEENVSRNLKKFKETKEIVADFITAPRGGMMLINWAHQVNDMKFIGSNLSKLYPNVPIIVLTTVSKLYYNQKIVNIKVKNIQMIIEQFSMNSHIIIIANRYSTRGLNYTNHNYTRFITHQVIFENKNVTNFIQKCRILGNRPSDNHRPILYCMTTVSKYYKETFSVYLRRQISCVLDNITEPTEEENMLNVVPYKKLKKVDFVNICKQHGIKRYSKLRKQEIVELLKSHNIL